MMIDWIRASRLSTKDLIFLQGLGQRLTMNDVLKLFRPIDPDYDLRVSYT